MPTEKDLFAEEQSMVSMSFGEHIEELRLRLILAIYGLGAGVVLTLIPPLELGRAVMFKMQEPAQRALVKFYTEQTRNRALAAKQKAQVSETTVALIPADEF